MEYPSTDGVETQSARRQGAENPSPIGFANHLIESGKVSNDAVTRARQIGEGSGEKFSVVLTRLELMTERERTNALAHYLGLAIATPISLIRRDGIPEPAIAT